MKRILVVGGGGREHALVWRLARDPEPCALYAAPGNPGMAGLATLVPVAASDTRTLVSFCVGERIDLAVVGPEGPLVAGLSDALEAAGVPVFGPSQAASRLEGSKAFAKTLCRTHDIPTAEFKIFTAFDKARAHIANTSVGLVVKADGLCAGKGVFVCALPQETLAAAEDLLVRRTLGPAGETIVVEERLKGEELSVFALTDGESIFRFAEARDHKRLKEADEGPNTGGMGAFSPVPDLSPALLDRIDREILVPIVHAMRVAGCPYRGVLYAGLMITPAGPKVIEFNVRFGDPEAQALLPRLTGALGPALLACARGGGGLDRTDLACSPEAAVAVVAASEGYPSDPVLGRPIQGLEDEDPAALVFHAGTAFKDGRTVTAGGRVLAVTGLAPTLAQARELSYHRLAAIRFEGMQFRRDIALPAERATGGRA